MFCKTCFDFKKPFTSAAKILRKRPSNRNNFFQVEIILKHKLSNREVEFCMPQSKIEQEEKVLAICSILQNHFLYVQIGDSKLKWTSTLSQYKHWILSIWKRILSKENNPDLWFSPSTGRYLFKIVKIPRFTNLPSILIKAFSECLGKTADTIPSKWFRRPKHYRILLWPCCFVFNSKLLSRWNSKRLFDEISTCK